MHYLFIQTRPYGQFFFCSKTSKYTIKLYRQDLIANSSSVVKHQNTLFSYTDNDLMAISSSVVKHQNTLFSYCYGSITKFK